MTVFNNIDDPGGTERTWLVDGFIRDDAETRRVLLILDPDAE